MTRLIRIEYKGAFYHVTARRNERKRIFFNKIDYQKFKVNTRFSEKLEKDRKIRRGVQEIMRDLSHVKAWYISHLHPGFPHFLFSS